jgi:hypothetical protein
MPGELQTGNGQKQSEKYPSRAEHALMLFLAAVVKGGEVYLAGLIPTFVGIVLVLSTFNFASKD